VSPCWTLLFHWKRSIETTLFKNVFLQQVTLMMEHDEQVLKRQLENQQEEVHFHKFFIAA
jgi:hypothetical protein